MKLKLFRLFTFVFSLVLASQMQIRAQSADFSEYTRNFFSQPKTYSIANYAIAMLGLDGFEAFDPGEATFTVTSDGFSYKFDDGNGSTEKIVSPMKNVTVATSRGDVKMQMYILDDGNAVRAIKFKDGHCAVHTYTPNSSGKYFHTAWFTLRK